jgi:hypothetical protein
MRDPGEATPASDLILYQTEDGKTRIQCRFEEENLWLSQAQIGDLYQKDVKTINEHLLNIYEEKELAEISTIRKFRIVRIEGKREVAREISHYSLQAILAVGFRVRSQRGTQFRQWANERLSEYLVKGFAMDDERLRQPVTSGLPDYFDELLERIRDIRASEQGAESGRADEGFGGGVAGGGAGALGHSASQASLCISRTGMEPSVRK